MSLGQIAEKIDSNANYTTITKKRAIKKNPMLG